MWRRRLVRVGAPGLVRVAQQFHQVRVRGCFDAPGGSGVHRGGDVHAMLARQVTESLVEAAVQGVGERQEQQPHGVLVRVLLRVVGDLPRVRLEQGRDRAERTGLAAGGRAARPDQDVHQPGVLGEHDQRLRRRSRVSRPQMARDVVHAGLHVGRAIGEAGVHQRGHLVAVVGVCDRVLDAVLVADREHPHLVRLRGWSKHEQRDQHGQSANPHPGAESIPRNSLDSTAIVRAARATRRRRRRPGWTPAPCRGGRWRSRPRSQVRAPCRRGRDPRRRG